MLILGVIPARYNSTRFPGKPLAKILNKPMIQWVYENAKKVIPRVVIATDDRKIMNAVWSFGAEVMLTSKNCSCGTDRIAEVAKKVYSDIVVNIQGDEPLISSQIIKSTIDCLIKDKNAHIATACSKVENKDEIINPDTAKIVLDKNNYAIYFSRSPIPFFFTKKIKPFIYKHIGIYIFRRNVLFKFTKMKKSFLEKVEGLEQLRAIENGFKIKCYISKYSTIGVDRPDDILKVERLLKTRVLK